MVGFPINIIMKSKFTQIFENVMKEYSDNVKVKGGDLAKISASALKIKEIRDNIEAKKGPAYLLQLEKLANENAIFLVSALKRFRPTSSYMSEETGSQSTSFEEADIVIHKVPGFYAAPMSVPVAILEKVRDSSDVTQHPISDDLVAKNRIDKGSVVDDSYNTGKQPKGTAKGKKNNKIDKYKLG